MKKTLFSASIISLFILTACGGNPPAADTTPTIGQSATVGNPSQNILIDTAKATNQPSQSSIPIRSNNATTAALNPEHGNPGHRCDLAVGAPLNSPSQQVTPPTMPVQSMPAPNANSTARLNPAHGAPSHDCAIPVGQPLKN